MVLIFWILLNSPVLSDRTKLMQYSCQKMLSGAERPLMQSEGNLMNILYNPHFILLLHLSSSYFNMIVLLFFMTQSECDRLSGWKLDSSG